VRVRVLATVEEAAKNRSYTCSTAVVVVIQQVVDKVDCLVDIIFHYSLLRKSKAPALLPFV
jgi:hypothetical protein